MSTTKLPATRAWEYHLDRQRSTTNRVLSEEMHDELLAALEAKDEYIEEWRTTTKAIADERDAAKAALARLHEYRQSLAVRIATEKMAGTNSLWQAAEVLRVIGEELDKPTKEEV